MRSRRSDRSIVLGLIAALFFEIALLFWHMGIISLGGPASISGEQIAGTVFKSNNELRRRSMNSLVWEKSAQAEPVFYYDSVLTLAQSAATLKLANDVEVELSENTLVTIEPEDQNSEGEIRLKFLRGNLQARNPFSSTKIESAEFNVSLSAGSEMQLRQTGEHEFEVQMKKGAARLESGDGIHDLSIDGLLRISGGKTEALVLDSDFAWTSVPARRTYTHEDGADVVLAWKGQADELHIQALGFNERVIPLREDQREMHLRMPLGHHLAYLRTKQNTSAPADMEIWRAPTLHLITPLPRNRLRTAEENQFRWTRIPEASGYEFHLDGTGLNMISPLETNSISLSFESESDAEWSVWAKDKQGYMIPPAYRYPVFLRHQPFAAPKLNMPRLRKPAGRANDGASLWQWMQNAILPRAYADEVERFEAIFSWEKVEGADLYLIEISETPDFRHTVVSRKLAKPEFLWTDYKKRPYYWRVAAGSLAGRMGVFSEPELVTTSVEIRRVVPVPPAPVVTEVPSAPKVMEPPPVAVKLHEGRGLRVLAKPSVGLLQARAKRGVRAELSGIKLMSFAMEKDFLVSPEGWWNVDAQYSRSTFKPESKSDYPFQRDVVLQSASLAATHMRSSSVWGFGFSLSWLPEISRAGFEEIEAREKTAFGVHARSVWNLDKVEYQVDIHAKAGEGLYGLSTNQRLLRPFFNKRVLLGVGTDAFYIFRGNYSTLSAEGFLLLGIGF